MKDTGNTEAPAIYSLFKKNESKQSLSDEEGLLIETRENENEFGNYSVNRYVSEHPEIFLGDEIKPGKTNTVGRTRRYGSMGQWRQSL